MLITSAVAVVVPSGAGAEAVAAVPCPRSVVDPVGAAKAAKNCGARVEIMTGRSETGQVFANPDGTATMETSIAPRWAKAADGTWRDVDTRLAAGKDGVRPAAGAVDVAFSGGGSGPAVTMVQDGKKMTMSWQGVLPAPRLDESTATYSEVLPGVDLALTATTNGFQHVLVVKDARAAADPALRKISFKVGGDVVAKATPDGRVRFADRGDRSLAFTAAASTWDSRIDPAAGGEVLPSVTKAQLAAIVANPTEDMVSNAVRPGSSAASTPLGVSAEAGALVLTPDAKMLADPKTVYPVFIDPSIAPSSSKWAYANTINSNWDIGGQAWVGKNSYDSSLYRSFFDFPSTSGSLTWRGKHVLTASVNLWLDHSWSCGGTPSYMFRPGGAITVSSGARMAWTTRPLGSGVTYLSSANSNANEAGGCGSNQPDQYVTFAGSTLLTDVRNAAAANWTNYPVGLCACSSTGAGETTQDRWKKFFTTTTTGGHAAPSLSVSFNTIPGTPANLAPHSGVACGGQVGTTSPTIQAQYVDADTADTLNANFEWKELPSGTVTTVAGPAKPANNTGTLTLALGASAEGKTYSFRVQTRDAYDSSAWSGWCDFTVNASAPTKPNVVSSVYTACDPGNIGGCTAAGGPGVPATFTFSEPAGDPHGQDVVSYTYGWNSPTTTVTVAPGAASPAISLTPPRYGLNTLYVYSKDGAGTPSPTTSFIFLVNAPSAPVANFPLSDIRAQNYKDTVSGNSLTTSGNATWVNDAQIIGAKSAHFDSYGAGTLSVPALNTAQSFSVSAWVRPTALPTGNMTAVGQDGATGATGTGGFFLGLRWTGSPAVAKWSLMMADTATGGTPVEVFSTQTVTTADLNRWVHLTGVYDAAEKRMSLHVNGGAPTSVARTATPWQATGPLTIGRGWWGGGGVTPWSGEISDVKVWNRVVVSQDLNGTVADPINGIPAQPGILAATEVGSWDFSGGMDCYCDNVLDGAYFGRPLTLDAGWTNVPPTSAFALPGHDENDALLTDGVAGYAQVSGPVLRTDHSLSVSAWVKVTAATGAEQVVLRQGGAAGTAMKLYLTTGGKWAFSITNPDGAGGLVWKSAMSGTATVGDWVHLVGVYNAGTGEVLLYVDNTLQATKGTGALGWHGTDPLFVGANSAVYGFFGGSIDQVKAYQGALTAAEVAALYNA